MHALAPAVSAKDLLLQARNLALSYWQKLHPTKIVMSHEALILISVALMLSIANFSFWRRLSVVLGSVTNAWTQYIAIALFLLALMSLLISLLTPRMLLKPLLGGLFIVAAGGAYFMDSYGAVIDRHALQSVLESDARESAEWLTLAMIWPILLIGLLPATLLWKSVEVARFPIAQAIKRRLVLIASCALVAVLMLMLNFQTFASLGRNHAVLRDLLNPINFVNAVRGVVKLAVRSAPGTISPIAMDIQRGASYQIAGRKPVVMVLVVGESARASSFGLHGYARDTTPNLAKLPLSVFTRVHSCGTNTATSVPCMFSNLGRASFDESAANSQENLLDAIARAGFIVQWFDNNTGSKKVAMRLQETDLAHTSDAEICAGDSCFDEILLKSLVAKLDSIKADTVIVMHQLGSHGPAYFQRVPSRFAQFKPICERVELQNCSRESLVNSYDNTILYTDYVLSEMISRLQQHPEFDSALMYVSDHGESTGESGFYLHGAPYAFAPEEQTHVPLFFWQSPSFRARRKLDMACVERARIQQTSHDAVFPMLLNLLDLRTDSANAERDPLAQCG